MRNEKNMSNQETPAVQWRVEGEAVREQGHHMGRRKPVRRSDARWMAVDWEAPEPAERGIALPHQAEGREM